jgi:hypothetical protein
MRKEESDAGKVFGLRPPFIGSLSSVDLVVVLAPVLDLASQIR